MDTTPAATPVKTEEKEVITYTFSMEILPRIKAAQLQNGLRHGDYQRYRFYCSKRVRRIRRGIKFLHGKRFHKKSVELKDVNDVRYLEMALVLAERAWAYSMQLKEDSEKNSRAKFHANRKLSKAVKWGDQLAKLCDHAADDKTKLEAHAYNAWLRGIFELENEEWPEASKSFVTAKTIYEQLASVSNLEAQDLFQQRVEEIETSIRYCSYKMGKKESIQKLIDNISEDPAVISLREKLESVLDKERGKQADSLKEINWREKRLPVKNEKIRLNIVGAQDLSTQIDGAEGFDKKMKLYDQILSKYNDALRYIREELTAMSGGNQNNSNTKAAGKESLQLLQEFVDFHRLESTAARNLMLIESLEKKLDSVALEIFSEANPRPEGIPRPDEVVRMYDLQLATKNDMTELDEQYRKTTGNTDSLFPHLNADLEACKAARALYVGLSYVDENKFAEATALFDRALQRSQEARKLHASSKIDDNAFVARLDKLDRKIRGWKPFVHATSFLETMKKVEPELAADENPAEETPAEEGHLAEATQDDFTFIEFPPKLEIIACKPLLFDLALQSVSFPDLEEKKKAPRSGLFGFFSRN
eukprot:TRINITY_DN1807_c0_g1_i1.p1 TRINITY_DN1807_c0_g1~~TRINITY_DN1807_c0_g1_i1.p1  ORF type:complete len:590 (-),score=189.25 TRINITY_DN1807_c0_g1_i1:84-1853(-)